MLETKNVFLDAEAIIAQNFDYKNDVMRSLVELVEKGRAHLLTTQIAIREVEANIGERVRPIRAARKRFRKDHPIANNLDSSLHPMSSAFDPQAAEKALIAQYHEFLKETKTEVLSTNSAAVDEIFDRYFDGKPPFGEGKKKSEFPDAFTISTLEKWCSEHGERIYVIGQDPDLRKYCVSSSNLVALDRPGEFIDKVLTQDAAIEAIEKSVADNGEAITLAIGNRFERLGFYLDDEEGDVNDTTLERVTVGQMSLLDVTGQTVKLEVYVTIDFVVDVVYDDMDTAVWDSEDKISIPLHTIHTELTRTHETAIILTAKISVDGEFQAVVDIEFPNTDIPVSVNRYEDYG